MRKIILCAVMSFCATLTSHQLMANESAESLLEICGSHTKSAYARAGAATRLISHGSEYEEKAGSILFLIARNIPESEDKTAIYARVHALQGLVTMAAYQEKAMDILLPIITDQSIAYYTRVYAIDALVKIPSKEAQEKAARFLISIAEKSDALTSDIAYAAEELKNMGQLYSSKAAYFFYQLMNDERANEIEKESAQANFNLFDSATKIAAIQLYSSTINISMKERYSGC